MASSSIIKAVVVGVFVALIAGCSRDNNPTVPQAGVISGRVTESSSGNPVGGASVATLPATSGATSDNQGNFSLPGIPPANYTVTVAKANYFISSIQINLPVGDTALVSVILALKESGAQPGEERILPFGDTTMTMVWVPAGSYQMGSPTDEQDRQADEGPVHTVTFAEGFWMGKYEVTQGQWQAVMGANPSALIGVGSEYPVYNVSWNDVQTFARRLGGMFHLPSESEWEYACRAGTTTRYYWGDDSGYTEIEDHAWYVGNCSSATHPVGLKGSNAWGLYDMSGNVWEWCEDWIHDDYENAPTDGKVWIAPSGNTRVIRGGSWKCPDATYSRSARRLGRDPATGYNYIGFRLVVGGV